MSVAIVFFLLKSWLVHTTTSTNWPTAEIIFGPFESGVER
jgi:hypothetical protein